MLSIYQILNFNIHSSNVIFRERVSKNCHFRALHNLPHFSPRHMAINPRVLYTKQNLTPRTFSRQKDFNMFQHIRKLRGVSKFRWSSVHPVFTIPSSPLKRRKVVETFMVMRSESEFFICPWHVWLVDSTRERSRETVWQSKVTISSAAPSSFSPAKGSSTCTLAVSARSNFDPFHCNIHCEPLNGHQHN